MSGKNPDIGDQGIITALGHPLRARILAELDGGEASPKELAASLEEKLGNVSYHVRILARLGMIELVRRTPRRGAVEHHYRVTPRAAGMLHVELHLGTDGWDEVSDAVAAFGRKLADISRRHGGETRGRAVVAILGTPAR